MRNVDIAACEFKQGTWYPPNVASLFNSWEIIESETLVFYGADRPLKINGGIGRMMVKIFQWTNILIFNLPTCISFFNVEALCDFFFFFYWPLSTFCFENQFLKELGESGWHSGYQSCFPLLWPRIDFQAQHVFQNLSTLDSKGICLGFLSLQIHLSLQDLSHRFRSEEHTSELQSRQYLVCRLLLEKKKKLYIYLTLLPHPDNLTSLSPYNLSI